MSTTKCARCGREGSRNFTPGMGEYAGGFVCAARDACSERIAAADRRVSIYRSDFTGKGGKPSHSYRLNGERVPGVTTLLDDGLPKPFLVGWGINAVSRYAASHLEELWAMRGMGDEAVFSALRQSPYTERNDAGARGTTLHGYAERLMRGEDVDVPAELLPWVESVISYLDDFQPRSVLQETPVGNSRWLYGGTLDDVSDFPDGVRRIVDYKSSRGVYAETALQLAAYADPENVFRDPETGVERTIGELGIDYEHRDREGQYDAGYVVHIRPEGYRVVPAYIGPPVRQAFQRVAWLARFRAKGGTLDSWLGEPVQPHVRERVGA